MLATSKKNPDYEIRKKKTKLKMDMILVPENGGIPGLLGRRFIKPSNIFRFHLLIFRMLRFVVEKSSLSGEIHF